MFIFLIVIVFFLTLLRILTNNVVVWWRIFLIITIIFIILNKSVKGMVTIINYFVIQESLGLLFLIIASGYYQFFIILIKVGVSPFHFWLFRVTNNIVGFNLLWFLTFQKLPFLVILLQIFWFNTIIFLIIGLLVCYLQIFLLKNYKNLIVVSSTESFSWIILGLFFSFINSFFLFFYYIFLIILLIVKMSKQNLNFFNWETVLVFLNLPFSVSFFVKIFTLSELLNLESVFVLLLLILIFLSVLSFSFWIINLRVKTNVWVQNNRKVYFFLTLPLIIIFII